MPSGYIPVEAKHNVNIHRALQATLAGPPRGEVLQYITSVPQHAFIWAAAINNNRYFIWEILHLVNTDNAMTTIFIS